jgi:hypothetical protein
MDKLPHQVCRAGHEAVLKARTIWGGIQENEINEVFLSALIAVNLHAALQAPVRAEVDYALLCADLELPTVPETLVKVQRLKADVVVYKEGEKLRPEAIVEVKKFAERGSEVSIVADLHKGDPIQLANHLRIYAGIFVCATTRRGINDQMQTLEKAAVNRPIIFSPPQLALNGEWMWCFGCMSYSAYN